MPTSSPKLLLAIVVLAALPSRARAGGEIIVIDGHRPTPHVRPRVLNHVRTKAPPYSDAAIESDAWTRAWLLLDVDERGRVTRFKFIKRPGHDLEGIAAQQAFGLHFDPARDDGDRRIKSWVVWGIEWPSYWWLVMFVGTATRMPPLVGTMHPRPMSDYVPCRGSGPLNLDSAHPVYRDCSLPDLSVSFDAEPWISAPARAPRP
jgi:hypothetical protein